MVGNFLRSCTSDSFSRWAQLHGVLSLLLLFYYYMNKLITKFSALPEKKDKEELWLLRNMEESMP
jgi:hypothetical protein